MPFLGIERGAASRVRRWLEQAGLQVVPLHHNMTEAEIIRHARGVGRLCTRGHWDDSSAAYVLSMQSQLNGVLFTGGELDLTLVRGLPASVRLQSFTAPRGQGMDYVQTAKKFFDLATSNPADPFPIWCVLPLPCAPTACAHTHRLCAGARAWVRRCRCVVLYQCSALCAGFQMLNIIAAWNTSVLCDGCFQGVDNTPMALDLTEDVRPRSTVRVHDALRAGLEQSLLLEASGKCGEDPHHGERDAGKRSRPRILRRSQPTGACSARTSTSPALRPPHTTPTRCLSSSFPF